MDVDSKMISSQRFQHHFVSFNSKSCLFFEYCIYLNVPCQTLPPSGIFLRIAGGWSFPAVQDDDPPEPQAPQAESPPPARGDAVGRCFLQEMDP